MEARSHPALVPFSALFGMGARLRLLLYRRGVLAVRRLSRPVISVGNLTVGGSGKTPMVDYLASCIASSGGQVSILSRGYRGSFPGKVQVVCRGRGPLVPPSVCGDEPFLLARNHPAAMVVVGKKRYECGLVSESQLPKCVHLLDDGYQHICLERQSNILLMDARDPFGGRRLLPAGRLREPLSAIRRATLVCLTRVPPSGPPAGLVDEIRRYHPHVPVLLSWHEPAGFAGGRDAELLPPQAFRGAPAVAFAGIARPSAFFSQLEELGIELRRRISFPDHHAYTPKDIGRIRRECMDSGARLLVTTEKDEVKIAEPGGLELPLWFLKIRVRIEPEEPLPRMLRELESA